MLRSRRSIFLTEGMLMSQQRLRHSTGQLKVGRHWHDWELAQLHPILNVVIGDFNVLCPVRFWQSAGPFFTPAIILE